MRHIALFIFLSTFLSDSFCDKPSPQPPEHFSYEQHGTDWVGTCLKGKKQSPIPFTRVVKNFDPESRVPFTIDYKNSPVTVQPNSHTIKVTVADENCRIYGGGLNAEYKLNSFHMHWPSEHAILNDK